MNRHMVLLLTFAALTATVAACSGDSKAEDGSDRAAPVVSAAAYKKMQQAFADSVLNASSSSTDIAKKLGEDFDVGSVRLRDSLDLLASKTDCFAKGRQGDPYLAGTASFFVFMSAAGSNIVRVQESTWTSEAGNIVNSCLNLAAKDWKFNTTFGKPASYIAQVQFR